ncbi:MAG: glycosyltransferase family 9 protein [Candidatus Delongbacteria bacterium]
MIRILVIQLRRLGDVLMTTPLLRSLRGNFPDARLDFLCEPGSRQVLEHNSLVDEIRLLSERPTGVDLLDLAMELRRARYDWVIDCQGLAKTGLLARLSGAPVRLGYGGRWWRPLVYSTRYVRHNADYSALDKLRLLGRLLDEAHAPDPRDLELEFPVAPQARQEAELFCRATFQGTASLPPARPGGPARWPVAALFGVSRQPYKVWPAEALAEVGRRLAAAGLRPFLVHGPGEEEAARRVAERIGPAALVDYPLPSFPVLKEILARCALFVGNDGGPKHLAALSGIPSVAVFGRVHPESWTRPGDATQRWVATASETRRLPTRGPCETARSLEEIPAESVWREVESLLRGQPRLFQSQRGARRP